MTKGATVSTEGFRELSAALADLGKVTARNASRRALKTVAEQIADHAREAAPYERFRQSIAVSTRLNRPQTVKQRQEDRQGGGKGFVRLFAGSTSTIAHLWEYGSVLHGPKPFMRPAWDAEKHQAVPKIRDALREEIDKAAQRAARKAARSARKAAAG